jgi:hypothetical protein
LEQLKNTADPIVVTESGIVTDVRLEQCWNAFEPIVVTELPIVTDVRPIQLRNADSLIRVTELPIVTDVISEFSTNALLPILKYPSIITTVAPPILALTIA